MTKATPLRQYRRGLIGSTVTGSGNPLRKSPRFTVYTAAVRVERETLINLITALERHIIILILTVAPLVIVARTYLRDAPKRHRYHYGHASVL